NATNSTVQPPAGNATGSAVTIQNFAFNPGTLTVTVGTTVKWTNQDPTPHQIKSDAFNSQPLSQGNSFEFRFDTPGTYNYSCAIHPSMKGVIVVQ
ncbi:MAG: cupredoxin domain-containing protein, partial [Candidatus ainarchaeum sp.]|nr:cupredoxin domain-containing protein [Candidatus ainarchaeum sp.]